MPFVFVRTPDPPDPAPAGAVAAAIARAAGIDPRHVTVGWEELAALHSGSAVRGLVEIVAPDFHGQERIEAMLQAAAAAVARELGVEPRSIFAEFRPARPGQVLDEGEIVRW